MTYSDIKYSFYSKLITVYRKYKNIGSSSNMNISCIKFVKIICCLCTFIYIKLEDGVWFWIRTSIMLLHWHFTIFVSLNGRIPSTLIDFNRKLLAIYRVSQEECEILRESVPWVKLYRYIPKHLYPKLNGYGDNGQRSLKLWHLLHTYWLPNSY